MITLGQGYKFLTFMDGPKKLASGKPAIVSATSWQRSWGECKGFGFWRGVADDNDSYVVIGDIFERIDDAF